MGDSKTNNIDDLLKELKENPDKIYDSNITEEQLLEVTKKLNPYTYVRPRDDSGDDIVRLAAISHTNLQEDYIKRFLMTSMVGFIHRMGSEYQIDEEDRQYTLSEKNKEKIADKDIYTPPDLVRIQGHIRTVNKYVKELENCNELFTKLKMRKESLEIENKNLSKSEENRYEQLEKSILSLLYICTQYFKDFGEEYSRRMPELVKSIQKHKDVYDSILEHGYKPPLPDETIIISENFCKKHINQFIESYFEYNPDQHVRSALDKSKLTPDERKVYDKIDKYRPTMELLKSRVSVEEKDPELSEIFSDRETYNACMHLLKEKPHLLKKLSEKPEEYKEKLIPLTKELHLADKIPPADTFHRWGYYNEVNMEEIRNVVSAVYDEKPVFDLALQIYKQFEGTEEEVNEQKKAWISKYNEELSSDVNMIPIGNWVLLANYKKNRDEIDFYNRHTEVLRRIMQKHEEDKKLGKDLMNKRIKKAKTKNIKEAGKDAEIMKQYASQYQNLTNLGAKRALTFEEQREIENLQKNMKDMKEIEDVPDNAIQVNAFTHDAEKGEFTKTAFYTESEAPLTTSEIEEHMEKARKS